LTIWIAANKPSAAKKLRQQLRTKVLVNMTSPPTENLKVNAARKHQRDRLRAPTRREAAGGAAEGTQALSFVQTAGRCGTKKSARKNTWNSGTPHGSFLIIMPAHCPVKRFDASFISKVLSPKL
jgi:hypothetical protein